MNSAIDQLLEKEDLNEIMINSKEDIYYEINGKVHHSDELFYTDLEYENFIQKVCEESGVQINIKSPFADGDWNGFRLHVVGPPIYKTFGMTLRKPSKRKMTLESLCKNGWCNEEQKALLEHVAQERKNILVVGATGSGKTTLINSLLEQCREDRVVGIEEAKELRLPNDLSMSLQTRFTDLEDLTTVDQQELLKQSLRMRPDRLVLGEMRGAEAKDFLMALSTGHAGSMSTIHAGTAQEALLRLEMLIQMGAPQWSLESIRRLIYLTVNVFVVTKKDKSGWRLKGVYRVAGLESFGPVIESVESKLDLL